MTLGLLRVNLRSVYYAQGYLVIKKKKCFFNLQKKRYQSLNCSVVATEQSTGTSGKLSFLPEYFTNVLKLSLEKSQEMKR